MRYPPSTALLGLTLLCALPVASHAENYALLIGIDQYSQSDVINGLGGASNDAKSLAGTLEQVAGFKRGDVRVLTSDGREKPTGANITRELDDLAHHVRPGDTLFVLFSGHGIEQGDASYLVPWDADATSDASLARTSLPTTELRNDLSHVPAKAVILAFDMCRSDPRKSAARDIVGNNTLGRQQTRDLTLVPASGATPGPQVVATLFSCSLGERAWEWREKERGYFSYFLEQGLRRDAADSHGVVRLGNLVSYLQKAVPGAVQRTEGHVQTPFPVLEGPSAGDLVLATGRPPGGGGATAVVAATPTSVGLSPFDAAMQQGYEAVKANLPEAAEAAYQRALILQPHSAKALNALGTIQYNRKDLAGAEKFWHQAAAADPTLAAPVYNLGLAAEAKKDYPTAQRFYIQAIQLDPTDENPVYSLGEFYANVKDDPDEAARLFHQAIKLKPTSDKPVIALGQVRFGDHPEEAEALWHQAMALDPTDGQPVALLAHSEIQFREDLVQGELLLRQAIKLEPTKGIFHANLAGCLLKEGRKAEALEEGKRAMALGYKARDATLIQLHLESSTTKIPYTP